MSGSDVAHEVRLAFSGTPVILLTGHAGTISTEQARVRGVAFVVPKPPNRLALRSAIEPARSTRMLDPERLCVVVVDASQGFRQAILLLLRGHGHDVW
jgi:FixJ family two-component response regulator